MARIKKLLIASKILLVAFSSVCMISQSGSVSRVYSIIEKEGTGLGYGEKIEISQTVSELSKIYKMDPLLILAVMKVESEFNPKALSNRDARGLMQVKAIVIRDVAGELGISPRDDRKLFQHKFNLHVGVHYLSKLLKKFGGDVRKALMAYNAGPTFVARAYHNRPVPTNGYQERVLKAYHNFSNI